MKNLEWEDIQESINSFKEGAFAWIDFPWAQICGFKRNGDWLFSHPIKPMDWELLECARFFNESKEVAWTRDSQNDFQSRELNNDQTQDVIEYHQLILGTREKRISEHFVELVEDRGTRVVVPAHVVQTPLSIKNRLAMRIIYQVEYAPLGVAHFADCRFAGFVEVQK